MSLALIDEKRELTLDELACDANREYRLAVESGISTIEHAIACGNALLLARGRVPAEEWERWCVANVIEIDRSSIARFCRLAIFRDEVGASGAKSINQAVLHLRSKRLSVGPYRSPRRTGVDVAEAQKLRDQGWSYRRLGARYGVSYSTMAFHLDPAQREIIIKRTARQKSRRRAIARTLALQERDEAVRKRGGSAAKAYALLRRCALVIDASITETEDADERQMLTSALSQVHRAEDGIVRALRLERTQ